MPLFGSLSLKNKIRAIIMLTTGTALFAASAALVTNQVLAYRSNVFDEFHTYSKIISDNISAAIAFNDQKAALELLSTLGAKRDIVGVFVYDRFGSVFAKYDPLGRGTPSFDKSIYTKPHEDAIKNVSPDTIAIQEPVVLDGEAIGFVELQASLDHVYESIQTYLFVATVVFSFAIL